MLKQEQLPQVPESHSSYWIGNHSSPHKGSSARMSAASDLAKLIKMTSYQRAIANFVKILVGREVLVKFNGTRSYTNGEAVNIAADISSNNFDIFVGLALHEASHIKLTDFKAIKDLAGSEYALGFGKFFFDLINIIEDRRIDHFIYTTSPGYRPYYEKMYSHFFENKKINYALEKGLFTSVRLENYLFMLTNMTNPRMNPAALPKLQEVMDLIDLPSIGRLEDTQAVIKLCTEICDLLRGVAQDDDLRPESSSNTGEITPDNLSESVDKPSPEELQEIQRAYNKQKQFLSGNVEKQAASGRLLKELEKIEKLGVDIQSVDLDHGNRVIDCIVYDLTKKHNTLRHAVSDDKFPCIIQGQSFTDSIARGISLGGSLGRKLRLRDESRSLEQNRLLSGKLDSRRISHAGYGIETVFKRKTVDKHIPVCIHISLDASYSMSGSKWAETVQMTAAIVKAATYVHNMRVQVSIRSAATTVSGSTPLLIVVYDSQINNLVHFETVMSHIKPAGSTPEGLCFSALMSQKLLKSSSTKEESYFINISDGMPEMGVAFRGGFAIRFTKEQVDKMRREYGIKVISFFIKSSADKPSTLEDFQAMYGRDAKKIDTSDITGIAAELNKKFLTEGITRQ